MSFKIGDNVYDIQLHKKGIVTNIQLGADTDYNVRVEFDYATLYYTLSGKSDTTKARCLYHGSECEFDNNGLFQRITSSANNAGILPHTIDKGDQWEYKRELYGSWYYPSPIYGDFKPHCSCETTMLIDYGCKCGAFEAEQNANKK